MSKRRLERFYYRNGQIRLENKEVGAKLHGLCRTWHYNGQLATELRYRHGLLHGLCRQWNQKGRLLGSFSMNNGTGTQLYWHQNGQLRVETSTVDGKFHGRARNWLRDGTLVRETFHIGNATVTRAAYLQAARKHSDWPQYEGQPAGRVAPESRALQLREHETFVKSLLVQPHAEAEQWLSEGKRPDHRSLAKFRTARSALRFVKALYAAGAAEVVVLPIYAGKRGKLFADWLLVKLPQPPAKRRASRKLSRELCEKRDAALLPEKELGESHLFIRLA